MAGRELVVLGTASQAPTRYRNHNGYVLRWDREAILFDPGEGTQRQLLLAGVSAPSITRICITHLHGDHCLGLPGVIQRLSLDGVEHVVHLYYPASGQIYVDRLRHASVFDDRVELVEHPCTPGVIEETADFRLEARALDHRVDTLGYRLVEPDGVTLLPDRLDALGVHGADRGRLQEHGHVDLDGRRVTLDEVSVPKPGQRFAFVMDTRVCGAASKLAAGVDLLVAESTFLEAETELADRYAHLTARQAGELAAGAGARRLVLTHFSQRHPRTDDFAEEAGRYHRDVWAARDLDRIEVPPRPRPSVGAG